MSESRLPRRGGWFVQEERQRGRPSYRPWQGGRVRTRLAPGMAEVSLGCKMGGGSCGLQAVSPWVSAQTHHPVSSWRTSVEL